MIVLSLKIISNCFNSSSRSHYA